MTGDAEARFYREALLRLGEWNIPFLVGGAYALARYTGIERQTKDLDVFVLPEDAPRVIERFRSAGYRGEMVSAHWLGKVHADEGLIDIVFGSANGMAPVDRMWFDHAPPAEVFGLAVQLIPAEEMVWQKAFVKERGRYDGADIAHVLRRTDLDWERLLARFGAHWRVLLSHLVLFGFIYPSDRNRVPVWVMRFLIDRLKAELGAPPPRERVCYGTLLSLLEYLPDVTWGGYADARRAPHGPLDGHAVREMTREVGEDDAAEQGGGERSDGDRSGAAGP